MDVNELAEATRKAEDRIRNTVGKILREFTAETGMAVSGISLGFVEHSPVEAECATYILSGVSLYMVSSNSESLADG